MKQLLGRPHELFSPCQVAGHALKWTIFTALSPIPHPSTQCLFSLLHPPHRPPPLNPHTPSHTPRIHPRICCACFLPHFYHVPLAIFGGRAPRPRRTDIRHCLGYGASRGRATLDENPTKSTPRRWPSQPGTEPVATDTDARPQGRAGGTDVRCLALLTAHSCTRQRQACRVTVPPRAPSPPPSRHPAPALTAYDHFSVVPCLAPALATHRRRGPPPSLSGRSVPSTIISTNLRSLDLFPVPTPPRPLGAREGA